MADTKDTEQDPSIEDILHSIRQIISEDDEEEGAAEEQAAAPEPEPEPEVAEPEPEPKEDILDLTNKVEDEDVEAIFDEDDAKDDAPDIGMEDIPEPEAVAAQGDDDMETLLSDQAKNAAMNALGKLAGNMYVERQDHMLGITLEDIVREMMRPMLKDWMDQNLPRIIEKQVQKEIQNLAKNIKND